MQKHIANARAYGIPVVVAINEFSSDTLNEIDIVKQAALDAGAFAVVPCKHWAKGGAGATDLALAVKAACAAPSKFEFLYPLDISLEAKIRKIACTMYGASDVSFTPEAAARLIAYERMGLAKLPICMAKTHLSLSHDPERKGVPTGFVLPIRDVRISAGAGFVYPLVGTMQTMPGLPTVSFHS
jgi:methylenetetrahydrofolate dehydrogenase (NADP+)/methenyltetrahydrofolate cyclohydrolase/formyltetrahydrofolate synthetase